MALDAATLALTAAELKTTLADAKIAKLFEPTRDELVITLRTRTETYSLLLSARSGSARVCLTEESFENPETPPSFCMLMRKHLTGGRLLDVRMEPSDRIVYFEFQCTNEMGDLVRNILCAELMGRYSNLVLVQNGKIIDALKRVDFEDSDVRQLLPGLPYTTPPKPARPDFLAVSSASIVAAACERDLPVALRVETLSSQQAQEAVTRRELDMAIVEDDVGFNPELQVTPLFRESFYMICSEGSDYPELVDPRDLDMSQEINVSQRREVQVWNDYWFGPAARPLLNTDTVQLAEAWPPTRRVWAAAPSIAAEHMRRAGRAKICRFTAPPPDRISYLIAPRAVQLPEEAALFLEDLRWELQQHPDVVIYF